MDYTQRLQRISRSISQRMPVAVGACSPRCAFSFVAVMRKRPRWRLPEYICEPGQRDVSSVDAIARYAITNCSMEYICTVVIFSFAFLLLLTLLYGAK